MQQHTKPWGAVMMAGVVAAWVGLWVVPAVAKLLAPVEVTGQTQCWDVNGFSIGCDDTDQDGDIQAGVPFPTTRFTDLRNGTVRDNLTGLMWLKDAGCLGDPGGDPKGRTWGEALAAVADLNDGKNFGCVDYTGAFQDWRLPNVKELQSLIHFGFARPALSNAKGTGQWTERDAFWNVGRPFLVYWSSTTQADEPGPPLDLDGPFKAWRVDLEEGKTTPTFKNTEHRVTCISCRLRDPGDPPCQDTVRASFSVWPVRGPGLGGQFAPAPVEVTGQTQCWDPNDTSCPIAEIKCEKATGQDGKLRKGEGFPKPRFTDLRNGTVRDNLTTLIWLKDASCLGSRRWAGALAAVADLNDGKNFGCVDYTGAFQDWRLPNVKELQSLIHFGFARPALSNANGTGQWTEGDAFSGVRSAFYWSSTTREPFPDDAWPVSLNNGITHPDTTQAMPPCCTSERPSSPICDSEQPTCDSEQSACICSRFGGCATKYECRRVWAVRGG
jgi:hypothetical protein